MLKKLLSLLTLLFGLLILFGAWSLLPSAETPPPNLPEPETLTDAFAGFLAAIFLTYLLVFLAILLAAIGLGLVIAGATGLLNTAATVGAASDRAQQRLSRLAGIRLWVNRAGWLPLGAGLAWMAVHLLRQNLGADITFIDYAPTAGTLILIGLGILFLSALGGLIARLVIRRLG